jgi:hypothetical protein
MMEGLSAMWEMICHLHNSDLSTISIRVIVLLLHVLYCFLVFPHVMSCRVMSCHVMYVVNQCSQVNIDHLVLYIFR